MTALLSNRTLLRYAMFGIPLGCIGLPLYVHLPKYYSDTLPLSLSTIGYILFVARIADCAADPYIGYLLSNKPAWKDRLVLASRIGLAAGVLGLFYLPAFELYGSYGFILCALLMATYLCYSVASIAYYSDGVAMTTDYNESARLSAYREAAIIFGVIGASMFPALLAQRYGEATSYHLFAWIFLGILVAASLFYRRGSAQPSTKKPAAAAWGTLFNNRQLRWLFPLYFVNAIATSITSTLFLFYVSDVLQSADASGLYLGLYFAGAIASMPLWLRLNRHFGKRRCLLAAMLLAIMSFGWAYGLGAHDSAQFFLICLVSGVALGGDLALLPSLLSDALDQQEEQGALTFGIWNFISKFNLALAAGIALPLVGSATPEHYQQTLRIAYAVIPCLFKIVATTILFISPLDRRTTL